MGKLESLFTNLLNDDVSANGMFSVCLVHAGVTNKKKYIWGIDGKFFVVRSKICLCVFQS